MRNLARGKQGVSTTEFEALCVDFNDVFPFDYVEIFLFAIMKMPGRSAFLVIILLHYKQVSSGFVAQYFKSCVADSNVVLLNETGGNLFVMEQNNHKKGG